MKENELVIVNAPCVGGLATESALLLDRVEALIVNSKESHGEALEGYALLKRTIKKITAHFEPTRSALEKAKKELLHARDSMTAPLEEAAKIISQKIGSYEDEENRRAKEAARIAEETERKRLEDEKVSQAIRAEELGAVNLAEAIIAEPVKVEAVKPAAEIATVIGVSARVTYHAEVQNIGMLIQYVAANPVCADYLLPNMPRLNTLARELKESLAIPGICAIAEKIRSVRS